MKKISSINKAAHWSESKLDELDNVLSTPFELFFAHIKLAFKVLFKGAQ